MDYIAHTPPKHDLNRPPHLYSAHVKDVVEYGESLLNYLFLFSIIDESEKEKLSQTFRIAMMLHDAGKLDDKNQSVFRGERKGKLPVDHLDAGIAIVDSMQNELAAWIIRGHHSPGLPGKKTEKYFIKQLAMETGCSLSATSLRGLRHKRSKEFRLLKEDYLKHTEVINRTDEFLKTYRTRQQKSCGEWPEVTMPLPENGLLIRLLLSCLVDADHGSAEAYSRNIPFPQFVPAQTSWKKRLAVLNEYVATLNKSDEEKANEERNKLRATFYQHCSNGELFDTRIAMCSAPVGLGKTTSVMAYLLRKSIKDKSSRIIVIAPFSNIIDQTVKTLKNAIILAGEDPDKVIVAHHHRAEFSDKDMRQYTILWRSPIIVTTAVQFFETLASANPTKLRKLSGIVGSSIFIDESHACLPIHLLKISWYWLRKLSNEWHCNIVFSSGSMIEFWNDEYLVGNDLQKIPDIFPAELQKIAGKAEANRVIFEQIENALCLKDIIEKVQNKTFWNGLDMQTRPSCLIIMNTVQSAAILAHYLSLTFSDKENSLQEKKVLHMSTALAPKDRDEILKEIARRQKNCEWTDRSWYLVATSCVEAGVNLDFSIGFRERCSVTSFYQIAGRINRHGLRSYGILYDFIIIPEDGLNKHPGFEESSIVFMELWDDINNPDSSLTELSTTAIRKEFSRFKERKENSETLFLEESKLNFQKVANSYRIITSNTATVIISKKLVEKLELRIPVDWQDIQKYSVQLWSNKIKELNLHPISSKDNVYSWIDTYEYDPVFLGIMGGLIKIDAFFKEEGGVI